MKHTHIETFPSKQPKYIDSKQSNLYWIIWLLLYFFFVFRFYCHESKWIHFLSLFFLFCVCVCVSLYSFVTHTFTHIYTLNWYFCLHRRNSSGREWHKFMWHFYVLKVCCFFLSFWQGGSDLTIKACVACVVCSIYTFITYAIIFLHNIKI